MSSQLLEEAASPGSSSPLLKETTAPPRVTYEIITIHNAPLSDTESACLLKVWTMQAAAALRHSEGRISCIRVISLAGGVDQALKDEIRDCFPCVSFTDSTTVDKLHLICTQQLPFIYLDACAVIVAPDKISELLDEADRRPFTVFNHQKIEAHTAQFTFKFLNNGVFCASNPRFLEYEKVKSVPVSQWCPGDDSQLLVHSYFLANQYSYASSTFTDARWNACGAFKRPLRDSASLSVKPLGDGGAITELVTSGLVDASENGVPVRLLNYWYTYKPWMEFCEVYETLKAHAAAAFSPIVREKGLECGLKIVNIDDTVVTGASVDGTFDPHIPHGLSWQFVAMGRENSVEALALPRQPLRERKVLFLTRNEWAKDWTSGPPFDRSAFIEALKGAAFVEMPGGECHEHYEAWAVGAVPVVEFSEELAVKYAGLPVAWTREKYADVTDDGLISERNRIESEWASGEYISRLGTFLRFSAYKSSDRDLMTGRTRHWMSRLAGKSVTVGPSTAADTMPVLTAKPAEAKITVFCAVWSGDPMRWQLLKAHQACLDKQTRAVERVYVFDGGDLPPRWLRGRHVINSKKLTIYEAWSMAVKHVKTPYVMNLNLDDRLCPGTIKLMEHFLDSGGDLVGGEWRIEFSQRATDGACAEDMMDLLPPFSSTWPPDPKKGVIRLGSGTDDRGTFGPATAWRMSLHAEYGDYPSKFLNGEPILSTGDTVWWRLLLYKDRKCLKVPCVIGRYYSHPSDQAEFRADLKNEQIHLTAITEKYVRQKGSRECGPQKISLSELPNNNTAKRGLAGLKGQ